MRIPAVVFASTMVALAGIVVPAASAAQEGYLFKSPVITLSLRGGASLPAASDDIHDFFTRELTLKRNDFRSVLFGGEIAARVSERIDLVLGVMHSSLERNSESREWLDANNETIDQTTNLSRTPVTVSARVFAVDRGRTAGNFAWVPNTLLPYAGAGVGVVWYELEQFGWFVDHETLDIFQDSFTSSGNAPLVQVFAGTEWWPHAHVGLTFEGRYSWARPELRDSFADFDNIDLRGLQLTAGISTRF